MVWYGGFTSPVVYPPLVKPALTFPSLQTVITELRSRIASKLAKGANRARHMSPAAALAEFSEPLRQWEASLKPRCHSNAASIRSIRMNIQTAAGSGYNAESFGITLAETMLDARTHLLGENAAWRQFMNLAEKNMAKVRPKEQDYTPEAHGRGEGRRQTPPSQRKTNYERPSGKNFYKYLSRTIGPSVEKGDCYICALLNRPQRGTHDFKTCRFFTEGLEAARKKADYSDRG